MRFLKPLLFIVTAHTLFGAARITVQQLQDLLVSEKATNRTDAEVARKLSGIELTEWLTNGRLQQLLKNATGPRTTAAIQLMADGSAFEPAPQSEWPANPAPTSAQQLAILRNVRQYAIHYANSLPNYIVTAQIDRFDDDPALAAAREPEVWNQLRARDRMVTQLRVADGHESYSIVSVSGAGAGGSGGLTTFGEFAGIVIALFLPNSQIAFDWDHWEMVDGKPAAVFQYSVPVTSSRFSLTSNGLSLTVAYRGRLFVDPDSGTALRITRRADRLPSSFPMRRSDTVVEFGPAKVGDATYFLPARSVSVSDTAVNRFAGGQTPRFGDSSVTITSRRHHLNEVRYSDYHKFSAESVLVADTEPDPEPVPSTQAPVPVTAFTAEPENLDLTAPPVTTFKSSTRLVEVPVIVRDAEGHLVTDLKQEDFAVFNDGRPQTIRLFRTGQTVAAPAADAVTQATSTTEPTAFSNRGDAAVPRGALNVLLIDIGNTVWEDQAFARDKIIKFLQRMSPGDRVGIYLMGGNGFQTLQEVTGDTAALVARLADWKGNVTFVPKFVDNSESSDTTLALSRWMNGQDKAFTGAQLAGSSSMWDPLAAASEKGSGSALGSLRTLDLITRHLAGIPGRKNLIWITAAFPLTKMTGSNSSNVWDEFLKTTHAMAEANLAIYPIDARGLVSDPGYTAMATEVPVPWALKSAGFNGTLDTMEEAAAHTGGRASINNNDISGAIQSVFDDSHFTYTLGFYPEDLKYDGAFHTLKVVVKDRPKAKLLYRPGFIDARPNENLEKDLHDALWSPVDASGLGLNASLHASTAGSCEVRVSVDPTGLALLDKGDRWAGKFDVSFAQKDEHGKIFAREDQNIDADLTQGTYSDVLSDGFTYNHPFVLSPGATTLRVVVRDAGSGNLGSITLPLRACGSMGTETRVK